jgi:Leishmanolysin
MVMPSRRFVAVLATLAVPLAWWACKGSTEPKPQNVIARFVGDSQTGLVGYAVNIRPAVQLTAPGGAPISGTSVTFAVASGGGSVTSATVTTNASGIAQVGSWVLGTSPGTNTMTATAPGVGSAATFTAIGQAEAYPIQIMNFGPALSAPVQAALDSAQAKWQRVVYRSVGTWPQSAFTYAAGQYCGESTAPAVSQAVPGLLILVKFDSIDGPGKILAEAGPCYVRPGTDFTIGGLMIFDTADVAAMVTNGTLTSVVTHEMGHIIGFGTLWNWNTACLADTSVAATSTTSATINDTYFSCPNAQAEFDSLGGTSYTGGGSSPPAGNIVPVENCGTSPYVYPNCGLGTVNSHWREKVMTNELMTGYINTGANPLSAITVGSFADEGYGVNYAAADAWVHTFTAPAAGGGAAPVSMGDDILHRPIYELDLTGRVIRVRRAP